MVDGLAPNVAYLPVAALAALTAALVTLVLAVSAWKKAATTGESSESEQSSSRRCSDERTDSCASNDSLFFNKEEEEDFLGSESLPSPSRSDKRDGDLSRSGDSKSNGARHRGIKKQNEDDKHLETAIGAEEREQLLGRVLSPDLEAHISQENESHGMKDQEIFGAGRPHQRECTPEDADPSEKLGGPASDVSRELEMHFADSGIAKITENCDSVVFTQLVVDQESIDSSSANANLDATESALVAEVESCELNGDKSTKAECVKLESFNCDNKKFENKEHPNVRYTEDIKENCRSDIAAKDSVSICYTNSVPEVELPISAHSTTYKLTANESESSDLKISDTDMSQVQYVQNNQEQLIPQESPDISSKTGIFCDSPIEVPKVHSTTEGTVLKSMSSSVNGKNLEERTDVENFQTCKMIKISNKPNGFHGVESIQDSRHDGEFPLCNVHVKGEIGREKIIAIEGTLAEIDETGGPEVDNYGGDDDDDLLDRSSIKYASDIVFFRYASVQHHGKLTAEELDSLSIPANPRVVDIENSIVEVCSSENAIVRSAVSGTTTIDSDRYEGRLLPESVDDQNNTKVAVGLIKNDNINQEIWVGTENSDAASERMQPEDLYGKEILWQKEEEEEDGIGEQWKVSERESKDDTHKGAALISQDTECERAEQLKPPRGSDDWDPGSDEDGECQNARSISFEISGADPDISHHPVSVLPSRLLEGSGVTESLAISDCTQALISESDRAENIVTTLSVRPPFQNNAGAVLDSTQVDNDDDEAAANNRSLMSTATAAVNQSRPFVITEGRRGGEREEEEERTEPAVIIFANEARDFDSACVDSSSFEMHEEATQPKPNNRRAGEDVFSCLPPCDVTAALKSNEAAAEATVEQDGKATSVQGSRRDHLTGKESNLENHSQNLEVRYEESGGGDRFVTVSPAPRYATSGCIQLSEMMSDSSRCDDHDRTTATGVDTIPTASTSSDGLERLDELAELLTHLASDGDDGCFEATHHSDLQRDAESGELHNYTDVRVRENCSRHGYQSHKAQSSSESTHDHNEFSFQQLKNEDLSSPVLDNYSVELDEVLNTTHSSYNADISNNYLISDESTTGSYPADSSVYVSSEQPDDLTSTYENSDLLDAYTTRSPYFDHGCDSSERTELLSIDESLSSAISPSENEFSLVEIIGNLKHDGRNEQSNKQIDDNLSPVEEQHNASNNRELVLKSLKALTLKLKISGAAQENTGGVISPSTSDHTTVSVSEFATDSSGILSKSGMDTDDIIAANMFDSDSPRRQRILKLLERDQERQLRLKELSDFRRESDGRQARNKNSSPSSQNEKEESGNTLRALESAIGHVQEIISRKESSFAHSFSTTCDLNENELQFTSIEDRMTIDTGRHVFRDQFDITNRKSNRLDNECPSQNRCVESTHVETNVDGHFMYKNSQEIKTDTDRYYYSSEISIESADVNDNTEVIYDSVLSHRENEDNSKFCHKMEMKKHEEFKLRSSDDRWQSVSDDENGMLIRSAAPNRSPLLQREEGEEREAPKSRMPHDRLFGRSEPHERAEKTPERGAVGNERRCVSPDVTGSAVQSGSRSSGEERAATNARSVNDDDIAQRLVRASAVMENGGATDMEATTIPSSPANGSNVTSPNNSTTTSKTPTPTKIKNLRFKLDPDIFDLPSENGYEDDEYNRRPNWRKQTKYNTFSALDLGKSKEPVKVVSVRTSVVPGGQKMVVKPVCVSEGQRTTTNGRVDDSRITVKHLDIDLRIRLETEDKNSQEFVVYDSKKDKLTKSSPEGQATRCYISNVSPAQSKRRSPVPDFWNQSLSPVSETCDFMPSAADSNGTGSQSSFDSGERNVHWSPENSMRSTDASRDESFSSGDNQVYTNGHCRPAADNASSEDEPIPFKSCQPQNGVKENGDSNGVSYTSTPSRPSSLALNKYRKHIQLPRKKFVPDPEAVERITGYKAAEEKSGTKPPLPPVIRSLSSHRIGSNSKTRIEQLRKRYLDSKSLMAAQRADGSSKFEEFLNRAQEDRAKLITSTPDLAAFEAAVRSQWSKARKQSENSVNGKENSPPPHGQTTQAEIADIDAARCGTPDEVWLKYVQSLRRQLNRRSQSLSYLETDIDAFLADDKYRSTTTLEPANSTQSLAIPSAKEHRIGLPIDESGRTKSEHELRIERSLQNLTVPEWYKHSQRPKTGFILEKKTDEKKGWAAVKSLTSSTSSLSSAGTKPKRPTARSLRSSRENLQWSRGSSSPASADNSYSNRWGRTHSGPVLSLAVAKAFREPYLGWRTRTPSSCASPSPQPDFSPPSWVVMDNNTDRSDTPLTSDLQAMDEEEDDEGDNGFSFEGEDVIETANTSSLLHQGKVKDESPTPHSADDTCEDVVNISMETCDAPQMVNGHDDSKMQDLHNEDTCDDIKNITMDTFELVPPSGEPKLLLLSPVGDDTSDDILNISTDTSSHVNHHHYHHQTENGAHLNGESIVAVTEDTGHEIGSIHTDNNSDACMMTYPVVNGGDSRSGSTSPMQQDCTTSPSDSQVVEPKVKESKERSRFDPKRKRYSYNRSIYQNELDGVVKVTKGQQQQFSEYGDAIRREEVAAGLHQDGGSTRSLPAVNHDGKSGNNVIWIESSFVGSRTTTSIMVMPPERNHKHKTTTGSNGCCRGGSTGSSNSSVGRPASR